MVAQWYGVANERVILLVLLATGACVPFQLLLNECLAAAVSRGGIALTRLQMVIILGVQGMACMGSLWFLADRIFDIDQMLIVSLLLAFGTYVSFRTALAYYGQMLRGYVTSRTAILIGSLPGLTSLCLYIAFALTSQKGGAMVGGFILATTFLPGLIQLTYTLRTIKHDDSILVTKLSTTATPVSMTKLMLSLVSLVVLTALSTQYRDAISNLNVDYAALLLVALNSLLSLINTVTRAKFLVHGGGGVQGVLAGMAVASIAALSVSTMFHWRYGQVIALIAVQAAIAWVIESSRRIPWQRRTQTA
jgi:hypothetical protein